MLLDAYHDFMDPSTEPLGNIFSTNANSNAGLTSRSEFSSSYYDGELKRYRDGHPELTDASPAVFKNVDFYRGATAHPTYGSFIDDFHDVEKYRGNAAATTVTSTWFGNYHRLEAEHSFIQHLFPIQEGAGLSSSSQRLQKHEIEIMKSDSAIRERLLRSVETMLDFYGIELDRTQADYPYLSRNLDNFVDQFANLNTFSHNYLRITRMCKCLGDLGLEVLQQSIVNFFIVECYEWWDDGVEGSDSSSTSTCYLKNLRSSLETHWVATIRDDEVRENFKQRIAESKSKMASAPSGVVA